MNGVIKDEASFMHFVRLYHYIDEYGMVILILPQKNEQFDKNKMEIMNVQSHDQKTRRENRGNIKGQPPYLSAPLVPFNMDPKGVSAAQINDRVTYNKSNYDTQKLALENGK